MLICRRATSLCMLLAILVDPFNVAADDKSRGGIKLNATVPVSL